MTPDEIQRFLETAIPPFVIETKGARSYHVTDRTQIWTPETARGLFCLAIPGKGIVGLRVSAIESVHLEHEPAGSR